MGSRGSFGSRFGVIAAVSGSVIGLGNIWRFPYVAGENGGAAFILIYLTISFLISIPIMLSEFSLGRSTKRNSMRAFSKLAPGTKWKWVGYMGILCAFIILSFYCVIAGWSLEFLKESVLNRFHDRTPEQVAAAFDGFVASGWRPIAWTLVFIAASAFIVYSGIEKGIERYNKILMPMLFVLLLGLPSCLGYGPLASVQILGMAFLDFFDFISNSVLMPIVAFFTCLLVGWVVGTKTVSDEVEKNFPFHRKRLFEIMVRWVAPILVVCILVGQLLDVTGIMKL